MSGTNAFFILIPAMYALFTIALTIIAVFDRRLVVARWAAAGFFVAFVSITVDGYRAPGGGNWVSWFTVATHFIPLLTMIQAFYSRHGRDVAQWAVALAFLACIVVMPSMPWEPPNWFRGFFVQAVCATLIASGLPVLWRNRKKSPVDWVIFAVIFGAALSYGGRSIVMALNPIGSSAADMMVFYNGLNQVFHAASALMGMSVGIVLMTAIGFDMVRGRTEEGEIDPLTRLGNRRKLDRRIVEDGIGKGEIGAVIVIDLDHFKRINDRFGHEAGDRVLRSVGKKLRGLFASFGTVCRVGGEEFVVLVDQRHADGISGLALSARKAIAGLVFDGPLARTTITASVGFHRRDQGESVAEAMQRADQAVYCAKTDGRDRVVGVVEVDGFPVLKAVA